MSSLSLRGIKKDLGGNPILRGVDLEVGDGELVVLVGPSGCGKSTLLRTVAGLEIPDGGTIRIGDRDVTHLPPRDRDVAMVFQSYALYPHLTVRDNLAFGLKLRGTDPKTIAARTSEVAEMLGLAHLLDRYPRQMSGGQRQRVAMGRAIARRPSIFLFDEPLSNLDAALRADVRLEIKRLHARLRAEQQGATMLYVTHDQVEAMTLADRLVVLKAGHVEQIGAPLEVYARPSSRFVASFLGSPAMNFVAGEIVDGRVRADGLDAQLEGRTAGADGALPREQRRTVIAGVRPHDVVPSANGHADITMRVEVIEAMGFEAYAHGRVGEHPFVARLEGDRARTVGPGDTLGLDIASGSLHLFDPDSERTLQ
ncbi:MAG: sn-glycerol-3-phosphate ABC transporter ATP-binding protein UgpC [Myxococcota bacterium]|nr:sn-glycerol-3-phosphate ABC transporter ATP-binding protein UgpC [Myxococcota bacterium]